MKVNACLLRHWTLLLSLVLFAAAPLLVAHSAEPKTEEKAAQIDPLDWPYWRGPASDGVSYETGLIDDFDPDGGEGSNVSWKREDLGGRSTPIVMRGKLYTLVRDEPGTATEGEKVVCIDAETGKTIWEQRFNVWLSDVPDTRVGWSSVVGDPQTGRVYALGVCGYFLCMEGDTGKIVWSHPLHEEFGLLSTFGGRTNFPVVSEDMVIINGVVIGWGEMAKPTHRFIGFDKATGEVVWFSGTRELPDDTTYSSPTLTVLNGQRALVFGAGDGAVWAFQPQTGEPIWKFRLSRRGLNVSPVVTQQRVYTGHSEENIKGTRMGAFLCIDGRGHGDITETAELWRVPELMVGKSSPVVVDGRVYCCEDSGKLFVLNAADGEQIGRRVPLGTMMRSSLLYADGKLYVFETNGRWYIMKPDEDRGVRTLKRGRMPSRETCHASPIASHGKIYMQSTGALYCLEDKSKKHGATERPAEAAPQPVAEDPKPAHLQVVPAEVLMEPGQVQRFQVRLYNAHGQLLGTSSAKFSLQGPGQISADGEFVAPADAGHVATTVTATKGDLSGQARIRIIPPLPWKFDFEANSQPPVTWVGARYRHQIRKVDGNNVMVKVTTIPKGTRSRCWFGPSKLHDYTIQADIRGARTDNKMPDIGLIAQGYALDLQGASQKLQIRSWVSHEYRTEKTIDFPWKPDTWYVAKLQASVDGGYAILKAKVWPRDQEEPNEWTLEMTDPAPNTHGSPGLYGNAKDAEIFLDNITVTSNVTAASK